MKEIMRLEAADGFRSCLLHARKLMQFLSIPRLQLVLLSLVLSSQDAQLGLVWGLLLS